MGDKVDPSDYLARLTRYTAPGRLSIMATPRTRQDVDHQTQTIFDYLVALHENSCRRLQDALDRIVGRDLTPSVGLAMFDEIRNCCYPYLYVPKPKPTEELLALDPLDDAFRLNLAPVEHFITIAAPGPTKAYLMETISSLLKHGYKVEAGLSIAPIPLHFAIEHLGAEMPKGTNEAHSTALANFVRSYFPVPNIAEIEDSFVDGIDKRRSASSYVNLEYQLFDSPFWDRYREYLSKAAGWRDLSVNPPSDFASDQVRQLAERCYADVGRFAGSDVALTQRCDPANRIVSALSVRRPKRLTYFDALRTDLSYARLRHYTGTSPADFQPFVLFTNYKKYVRRFVLRAVAHILRSEPDHEATLIVPTSDLKRPLAITKAWLKANVPVAQRDFIEKRVFGIEPIDESTALGVDILDWLTKLLASDAQMPAYHYRSKQINGIVEGTREGASYREMLFGSHEEFMPNVSLVNIGVGPSNARNITDHLAVLRPLGWLMVGHCGGLRKRQRLGDYVLANSYVRRDGILDTEVPLDAPIQPSRSINRALYEALRYRIEIEEARGGGTAPVADQMTEGQADDYLQANIAPGARLADVLSRRPEAKIKLAQDLKHHADTREVMRIGPVISVANRNWETGPTEDIVETFERYRIVAIDMESACIAANAYRYRVPHATFLCVSDRPMHGEVKMRNASQTFYAAQVHRHLDVTLNAVKWLGMDPDSSLDIQYPRELRGMDDPPGW